MFENSPITETRRQCCFSIVIGLGNTCLAQDRCTQGVPQDGQVSLGLINGVAHRLPAYHRSSARYHGLCTQCSHCLQRSNPILNIGIPTVGGCARLHQVTSEQNAISWQPDSGISFSMSTSQPVELYFAIPQVKNQRAIVANIGMCEAGDGLNIQEE